MLSNVHSRLTLDFLLGVQLQDINPRVKAMYEGVKEVLAKYRSGKVPKAFKIVPKLRNWEQILYLTGNFITIFRKIVIKIKSQLKNSKDFLFLQLLHLIY